MSVFREVASSAGHFIFSSNVGDGELVFSFPFEMIFSCLFWQMISEKGSVRAIATIILASSNSFLAPPPSHLLSLLFLVLTIPCSGFLWWFFWGFGFFCLFISFCRPFSYDFFIHQLTAFLSQAKKLQYFAPILI